MAPDGEEPRTPKPGEDSGLAWLSPPLLGLAGGQKRRRNQSFSDLSTKSLHSRRVLGTVTETLCASMCLSVKWDLNKYTYSWCCLVIGKLMQIKRLEQYLA